MEILVVVVDMTDPSVEGLLAVVEDLRRDMAEGQPRIVRSSIR